MQGIVCSCGFFLVGPIEVDEITNHHSNHPSPEHTLVWLPDDQAVFTRWEAYRKDRYGPRPADSHHDAPRRVHGPAHPGKPVHPLGSHV